MRVKKLAFVFLVLVAAALIAVVAAGSFLTAAAPESIGELPSNLSGKSIEFSSGSGATIHGWFIPGKHGSGAVVLMHGVRSNDDLHTTIEESKRLYETASEPKEFWAIQGAKHVDLHHAAPTEYESRVLEFFQKNLR